VHVIVGCSAVQAFLVDDHVKLHSFRKRKRDRVLQLPLCVAPRMSAKNIIKR
jgi:hypothetical protein